jgi:hypothetical protein
MLWSDPVSEQGRVVGQAVRWVIGGTKDKPALAPAKETMFNFVIPLQRPNASTNLQAKVTASSSLSQL